MNILWLPLLLWLPSLTTTAGLEIRPQHQVSKTVRERRQLSLQPTRTTRIVTTESSLSSSSKNAEISKPSLESTRVLRSSTSSPTTSLQRRHGWLLAFSSAISNGLSRRIAADPYFVQKSVTELILAAGTQLSAEWNRRGRHRLLPEMDFVVGGVLTAMAGKYYSMWRVAPTSAAATTTTTTSTKITPHEAEQQNTRETTDKHLNTKSSSSDELRIGNMLVPTNAFQPTMFDGVTRPTALQRVGALIAPMPYLFRAGILSSAFGYGLTALFIVIRSMVLPSYQPETQSMNIVYASLYTGGFLALVSNLRYQILQGIIEPKVVKWCRHYPLLYTVISIVLRLGNGFLGSMLSIMGMRRLGLQRMK